MADVQPLRAERFDPAVAGPLADLVAPPYDVIDAALRAVLAARSPHNVVHVDLPAGEDYAAAAALRDRWRAEGALTRDGGPALWALEQTFVAPGETTARTRRGFFGRVRVTDYGPGAIRPHERTHPGPKEDRLRLTRATRENLSPIFVLHDDPQRAAWGALAPHVDRAGDGEVTDAEGTTHRLWRVADPAAIAAVQAALADAELLIADGHHRYETARAYADEIGGEGPHRYVLACLVALQDPGLAVLPTHRLVARTTPSQQEALAATLREGFDIAPADDLAPSAEPGPLALGYIDAHFRRPYALRLRDQAVADAALADAPAPYRSLDAAVLERLLLTGPLELTEDDIAHLRRFGYARTAAEARARVESGEFDLAFVLRPTPVEQVVAVARAGATMPPKSTFFYPKLLTGLLFSPLDAE